MPEWYLDFVDTSYKPSKDELIALFRVEPAEGISMPEAIGRVASESSIGTWTKLTTMTPEKRRLMAKAYCFKKSWVEVAYPVDLFEEGNMPQVLSSIAGNIFGMKALKNLRLEDVTFPPSLVKSFPGPQFGLDGIRKIFKVKDRPLTVSVPKPKVGMTSEEHAEAGYEAWSGGLDLLKDDENLSNQVFNKFERRAKLSFKMRDKAEKETGEVKSYLINVTAETKEMLRDGWVYTGDIGYFDDGYLSVVDRKKDMIIAGGYNIYPVEIDDALFDHPKILEACCIGVPDPYRGRRSRLSWS